MLYQLSYIVSGAADQTVWHVTCNILLSVVMLLVIGSHSLQVVIQYYILTICIHRCFWWNIACVLPHSCHYQFVFLFSKVGERKFTAHRIVLAASIPYFHAMFTHDMVESKQNEITMQGIDPRYSDWVLKICIRFYYLYI